MRQAKLTLLERTLIAADTTKTTYETTLKLKENINLKILEGQIRDQLMLELGVDEKKADRVSIAFLVTRTPQLGVLIPSDTYLLSVIDAGEVTRLPENILIQIGE